MGFQRIVRFFGTEHLDQVLDHLELLASFMLGRGVLDGLELSPGAGLSVQASGGAVLVGQLVLLEGASGAMPPWSERFVFVDETGVLSFAETFEDPGGSMVCLGKAVSNEADIESVSNYGRWQLMRQVTGGDLTLGMGVAATPIGLRTGVVELEPIPGAPTVRSSSAALYSVESGGTTELAFVDSEGTSTRFTEGGRLRLEDPIVVGHARNSVEIEDLSTNKTLTPGSPNVQVVKAIGAPRQVRLPENLDWGMWFRVVNSGGSGSPNVLLTSHDGATTISTIGAEQEAYIEPTIGPSGVA
ncbi:hypothetical protein EON81_17720, partial [bacterium]